ncbi:MAG: RNA polymerase sigma factor [Desulfobacteraceae bacterium]|nr:MAG: RNA polymerase sigma factor [Desulfobacteraceae bacterium]
MSDMCLADSGGAAEQITEWVKKAQAGDKTAFHRLADHFQAEIYRMIFYRTRSRMDAEDLTQDVFLKAFKHIRRLESPPLFRSWLFRIALNRVRDHNRRSRIKSMIGMVSLDEDNFQETQEMAVPPQAAEILARKDFWNRVQQLLTLLSRMEREVFLMRFFDQLSLKEISAAMQKNENTIKTHLYRALHKVKTAVMAQGPGEEI